MKNKFNRNYSSSVNKNFSVYGGKNLSGISEKEEALNIARNLRQKELEKRDLSKNENVDNQIPNNLKKDTTIEKEKIHENEQKDKVKFEEISDEELKRRIEYAKEKNIQVIKAGINEDSDLSEILNDVVNDLFN
jgi:hypothetical protein